MKISRRNTWGDRLGGDQSAISQSATLFCRPPRRSALIHHPLRTHVRRVNWKNDAKLAIDGQQLEECRRSADRRTRMLMTLAENTYYDSLHVAFVVLCVQETVWVFAPTCYTLNLLAHSTVLSLSNSIHYLTITLSIYFALVGVALIVTLVLAQKFGLQRHQPQFFWPYLIVKLIRVAITAIGALYLALATGTNQLHLLAYCCVEIAVGMLAIDVAWRTMAFLHKLKRRRERIIVGTELNKIYCRASARF